MSASLGRKEDCFNKSKYCRKTAALLYVEQFTSQHIQRVWETEQMCLHHINRFTPLIRCFWGKRQPMWMCEWVCTMIREAVYMEHAHNYCVCMCVHSKPCIISLYLMLVMKSSLLFPVQMISHPTGRHQPPAKQRHQSNLRDFIGSFSLC